MNNRKKWTAYFDFTFFTAWLLTNVGVAAILLIWFGIDFRGYYAAARVLLAGGNPYDYHQVAEVLKTVTGEMGNNPYYYPPWFAWLFIPIAKLPFQIARVIWMAFDMIPWDISRGIHLHGEPLAVFDGFSLLGDHWLNWLGIQHALSRSDRRANFDFTT